MTDQNPNSKVASRTSWQASPMPAEKSRLSFERSFTQEEFQLISKGVIPVEMEDKWFVFLENDSLYFHRSWTGTCIYEIHLTHRGEEYVVTNAWVNRNSEQYGSDDDTYDALLLGFLIDNFLLGKMTPFPMPKDLPQDLPKGVYQHHISGSGYPEVESDEENKSERN